MTIKISEYGAVISDDETGATVYNSLKTALNKYSKVEVSFEGVITMATYCAKQIFGKLYLDLGSKAFFDRLLLTHASQDIKFIIRTGIESALSDRSSQNAN